MSDTRDLKIGQTIFIILVSERRVDHDAVVFVKLIFHRLGD
jgi:hypothetical protein